MITHKPKYKITEHTGNPTLGLAYDAFRIKVNREKAVVTVYFFYQNNLVHETKPLKLSIHDELDFGPLAGYLPITLSFE